MLWPVIFVVFGLGISLIGMIITFRSDPPHPQLPSMEEHWKQQTKFLMALKLGKIRKPLITRRGWSLVGVSMLWGGTGLQLIGAVWQMIRLACRG